MIGTDCIGSCKSNYHTITASTAPTDLTITEVEVNLDGGLGHVQAQNGDWVKPITAVMGSFYENKC